MYKKGFFEIFDPKEPKKSFFLGKNFGLALFWEGA